MWGSAPSVRSSGARLPGRFGSWPSSFWRWPCGWPSRGRILFAAFPVLYVISASFNPLGTVASTRLIPTRISLVNYQTLLSGARGPFLQWYLNTIIMWTTGFRPALL